MTDPHRHHRSPRAESRRRGWPRWDPGARPRGRDRPRALPRRARCRRHPRCGRRRHDQRFRPARRALGHARGQPQRPHPDPGWWTVDDRALALRAAQQRRGPGVRRPAISGPGRRRARRARRIEPVHRLEQGHVLRHQRARARAVVRPRLRPASSSSTTRSSRPTSRRSCSPTNTRTSRPTSVHSCRTTSWAGRSHSPSDVARTVHRMYRDRLRPARAIAAAPRSSTATGDPEKAQHRC